MRYYHLCKRVGSWLLIKLYYLIFWKGYLKEKNTWKSFLAVIYLQKLVNTFYKGYLEKPIAISVPLDFVSSIAKPTIKLPIKWKQGRLAKSTTKYIKKEDKESIWVSTVFKEPEAGNWLEVYLLSAKSTREPVFTV